MIEHVSLPVSDKETSKAFYDQALAPLGYKCTHDYDDASGYFADGHTSFWIAEKKKLGDPIHLAFTAKSNQVVDDFYKEAIAAGGKDNGKPGPREDYGYAAFVFDPDGHNIEAVYFPER